jgi:hypothetical protein
MPRNGSGSQSSPGSSFPAVSGTLIESAKFNTVINDINASITASIANDGQTPILANLPMSGFKHTGVAAANASGQYVEFAQYTTALAAKADTTAVTSAISAQALLDVQLAGTQTISGAKTFSTGQIFNAVGHLFGAATNDSGVGTSTTVYARSTTTNSYPIVAYNGVASGAAIGCRVDSTLVPFASFIYSTVGVGSITTNGTTTTYGTTSDYRLKENAQALDDGLSVINQLIPSTYNWKSNGSKGVGFIAHELQAVIPESVVGEKDAISEDGDPIYQNVDLSKIVPYLVKAIQELSEKVNRLESK